MPKRLSTKAKTRAAGPTNVVQMAKRKNPAAVALGRLGGAKSAEARMLKLTDEQRSKIASDAARARWAKEKGDS